MRREKIKAKEAKEREKLINFSKKKSII